MKVLHVASGDLWAGAEVQLFTLAKALDDMPEVELEVILLNHGRLEQELRGRGIKVIVVDEAALNSLKILLKLVTILREAKPDLVHTHRLKENILGSIAALAAGNIPSLRTVHGAPEHIPSWRQLPKRIIYWLDGFCGCFVQKKVVSVTEDLASILGKRFPTNKISIIENGVDLEAIKAPSSSNCALPQNGVYKIAIAGRLVPVKRVDIFIKTARYLLDHCPELNTEFHIYGDGPLRSQLEQLSASLKTDELVFFEGHCDNMTVALQGSDVLMMTSDHEGLPMVLLEAMATGTLVIAHAVGGLPTLLDNGDCGYLVHSQDESEYAETIKKVLVEHDRKNMIVTNALLRVKQHYSSQVNAQKYYQAYQSIIAGS